MTLIFVLALGGLVASCSSTPATPASAKVLDAYQTWNIATFQFNGLLKQAADECLKLSDDLAAKCFGDSDGFSRAAAFIRDNVEPAADRIPVPDEQAIALRRLAYDYTNLLRDQFTRGGRGIDPRARTEGMRTIAQEARLAASTLQARCQKESKSAPPVCIDDLDRAAQASIGTTPSPASTSTGGASAQAAETPPSTSIAKASPSPTASPLSARPPVAATPRFNPTTISCSPQQEPTIDRLWQVSAPRGLPGPLHAAQVAEIGLRNKYGEANENHYVSARVIAPNGTSTSASGLLTSSTYLAFLYPRDFTGADPTAIGIYTVIWESRGGFLACDGFAVTAN